MHLRHNLDGDTKVFRNDNVVWSSIDDEMVAMCIETGQYYGLDSISTRIWELLEKPLTVNQLCEVLLNEFDVEPQRCEEDVLALLNKLISMGLAKTSDGGLRG